jgi:Uma2 family endonuclease
MAVRFETFKDFFRNLGGISPGRVRFTPPPGKATEADLIRLNEKKERLYELVDGTLVEKVMGLGEAGLAAELIFLLRSYLQGNDLGMLSAPDGPMRLFQGLVRLPDVAFIRWDRLPVPGEYPREPIGGLAPDLAVEILSPSNTRGEMKRKVREYFLAGVRLVWLIDPPKRTVTVHTSPDETRTLTEEQTLDGGDVLPGLALPLSQVFARVPRATAPSPGGKRPKKRPGRRNGPS